MAELARTLRLTGVLAGAAFRSEMQYRAHFLMILGGLLYQSVGFAFVWIILSRFHAIAGWEIADMALLYGVRLCAHGIWIVPFNRMLDLDLLVQSAEFDRFLLRPVNPLIQVLTSKFWLGSFGDIIGGIAILSIAMELTNITFTASTVLHLTAAILGGALVESGVHLIVASFTFRLMSLRSTLISVDNVFSTFGNYPLKIFDGTTQLFLTYILPLAFVAYIPVSVILDRKGELHVPEWLAYGSPAVGILTFSVAYAFWSRQLRYYTSSGH